MTWQVLLIIVGVILGLFLLSYIFMIFFARTMYKRNFDKRYNDNHTLKYYTAEELNLNSEPISFPTLDKTILRGYLFNSKDATSSKGLIVFSHGIGAGHLPYMKEIAYMADNGYTVLAFDDKACNESDGEKLGGLTESLIDLDYCLKFVENNTKLNKMDIFLYGHGMGAFAVSNVTSLNHPLIKGVVALAPFNNEASFMYESYGRITTMRQRIILTSFRAIVKNRFKDYSKLSTVDSFDKSDIPHLIIAGEKDNVVDYSNNYFVFKDIFENKEGYRFISLPEIYNRPTLSKQASEYDMETNDELGQLQADFKEKVPEHRLKKFYEELDYDKLNELNTEIMGTICIFFDNCSGK
jgi:alpha-beta hydrolase superfamily lysophospholipase